jgi:hypothetical protein
MTFSEALEQYLDARDKLRALEHSRPFRGRKEELEQAIAAMTEASKRMDELMPCTGVKP